MNDTLTAFIAILIAVALLVLFPLWATADKVDQMSQVDVETKIRAFVDEAVKKGEITANDYNNLEISLPSQNNYVIELEVWRLDENSEKKASITNSKKVGENGYVGYFTADIKKEIYEGSFKLKKGDQLKASAYNTNPTIAQESSGTPKADIMANYASASATVY